MKNLTKRTQLAAVLILLTSINIAQAAVTSINDAPLASTGTLSVKPNVMFILDDSGSMGWEYLPDTVKNNDSKFCYRNSYYNGVYYNPNLTYDVPVTATGANFANSTFTAALTNGFGGTTTKDLSSQFRTGNDSADQAAYYYKYTGTTPATPVRNFCYPDTSYTRVNVSTSGTAAEKQNFANWYSYYRTRMLSMKSAAGRAFKGVGNSFRVGFSTISQTGVVSGLLQSTPAVNGFLKIADFDSTQKDLWYKELYGATTPGKTPLRGALSKAGRIYAGKLLTGDNDPVQYSCQQNFTILSTDGYWNTGDESPSSPSGDVCTTNTSPSSNYGAYGIDNKTCVGQQDGTAPTPMNDGAILTSTQVSRWNAIRTTVSRATRTSTDTTKTFIATHTQHKDKLKQQNVYSGFVANTAGNVSSWSLPLTISTVGRPGSGCSTCTVTITTASNHGLVTGDLVRISGVTVGSGTNLYNGTFTVTVTSTTKFTYNSGNSRSAAATTPTLGTWEKASWANGCAAGKGTYTIQAQRFDSFTNSTSTVTTTTTTVNTLQTDTTTVATTPQTRTVVTTNGVVTSDNTVAGTTTTTTNVPPPTVTLIPGSPVVTTNTTVTNDAGTSSTPTNFGAPTTSTCASAQPSPNPSTATTVSTYPASPTGDVVTVDPVANTAGFPTTGVLGAVTTSTISGPTDTQTTVITDAAVDTSTGGPANTLADIAMYYYNTDLRTTALGNCSGNGGTNVCENNVPGNGDDTNPKQHMTTFTLGLGADGTLIYSDNYLSGGSADFNAIKQGSKDWPNPITNSNGERIDDLWHAAVNGRGVYYSARDPDTLVTGLTNALAGVTARTGSAAAAATSNLEPVAGDNFLFVALYRTVHWDGDLQARTIDPVSGQISTTSVWTAQPLLDARKSASSDTRTIYTFDSTSGNKLKPFLYANLTAAEKAYFDGMCTAPAKLNQCTSLIANDAAAGTTTATQASGANLVNYLRGQSGLEDLPSNTTRLFRAREHILGDMVSSQPVYVKKPPFTYADSNYATFRDSNQANRTPMVYVAVNDGMLHAFNGDTGQEVWAYVPPMVMKNMYKLADDTYSTNHHFFVDGSPVVADICPNAPTSACSASQWKTILVGGLNAGGRGFYALDVTNPATPIALWNFTTANDGDVGLSFGNPVVAKRKDGTWVVLLTSGYNNVPGEPASDGETTGDGNGYLYVLNANDGTILEKIATLNGGVNVGTTGTPSGFAKINAKTQSAEDNTIVNVYGGDLLGNLWRISLDPALPPSPAISTAGNAFLLAQLGNANGAGVQPITTRPELTGLSAGGVDYTLVQLGTGRYLGNTDRSNTDLQSIYSIKDYAALTTGWGTVRSRSDMVHQSLANFSGANGEQLRTTSTLPVDWSTKAGWYLDLNPGNTSPGERVNVDVQLQLGSLTVATNVPSENSCTVGGYAFIYNFDFKSGTYLAASNLNTAGGKLSSNALVAGMNTIRLQSGKVVTIVTDTSGGIDSVETPSPSGGSGIAKRTSWRELIN